MASPTAELGRQEGRARAVVRGKSSGARTSLLARGVGSDVLDNATAALDKARPDSATALRLDTTMTCAGRQRG
jgi:hypothetical protein